MSGRPWKHLEDDFLNYRSISKTAFLTIAPPHSPPKSGCVLMLGQTWGFHSRYDVKSESIFETTFIDFWAWCPLIHLRLLLRCACVVTRLLFSYIKQGISVFRLFNKTKTNKGQLITNDVVFIGNSYKKQDISLPQRHSGRKETRACHQSWSSYLVPRLSHKPCNDHC